MSGFRTIVTLTVAACTLLASPALADRASSLNRQGIDAFRAGNYQESADIFAGALTERPESPEIRYNLGTALAAAGNVEDGIQQLDLAAERFTDDHRRAAAHYNAGSALIYAQDESGQALPAAIEKLKQAVMLDQEDEDYRYNLELAVRRYQDQQQQQQQQQQDPDREERKEADEQQSEQSDDEQQENDEQQEQVDQQQSRTEVEKERDRQPTHEQVSNQEENEDRPMTPEEALRILDAMNDEEKRALSLRRMEMIRNMRVGDDW